ncbi:MAG: putative Ig domain-containing protein, partial [Acidobacteriota bacterium]|nr:putative Ig domain-containing protein [Acidobacteriota bacterium]
NTAALSFAGTAGETQSFTISTTEDTDVEADETFTVGLTASGTSATVTDTDTATGTITNDDEEQAPGGATPTVTIEDVSADEGEALTFTVTLDKAVQDGLTVTPSFTDGTATKGTDYTENTAALSFAGTAGETQSFTVATTEDTVVEADETFTVGLAVSGTSETVTATDTATGTITDDDRALAAVTIADASAAEGDAITFTVRLHKAVAGGLTVTPSFTDVTATEGTDYTANTAALAFTGTAGETQSFTVSTSEDPAVEADETFTVSLTVSGTSETVTATDTATGTILDDDNVAANRPPVITAPDDKTYDQGETISAFDIEVTDADGDTVTVTVEGLPSGLSYTNGRVHGTVAADAATEDYTVTIQADDGVNAAVTETFTITVSEPVAPTATTAAVTIEDASADEGDSITFTVTLDEAVAGGLTVTPSFTDGTATKGADYTEYTSALSFTGTAGETRTFSVSTVEDSVEEGDETFTVSLAVSGTTATVTATDTATGRIADDDLTPVVLRADPARVTETTGATTVTVTAALGGGTLASQPTAVDVTVGAPDDTAESGTDYTASPASFTITIPAGSAEGSSTFTLGPVNDTLIETDETLAVNGDSGSRQVTGTTVTLEDDDTAEAHLVVRMDPDVISEHAGPTLVTVVAEVVGATPTVALPVTMTVGDSADTAESAIDYELVEAFTLTIPAGASQGSATFLLSPIEDDLIEGDETVTVTGDESRLGEASDQGTIRDEDLEDARSEGTGRTLFLLARAIGSESVAAIEERFASAGLGRRARLGRLPTQGPGAAIGALSSFAGATSPFAGAASPFGGSTGPFAGAGMPGAGVGMPGVAGYAGPFGSQAGSFGGVGGRGPGAQGMNPGTPVQDQPFDKLAWLDGANFAAPLGGGSGMAETQAGVEAGDEAKWMIWGRAATTRTAVQATRGAQANGDLFTMHAGVDTRVGSRVLLGLAVSHSRGKLGYTLGTQSDAVPAAVEGGLTSVQPYVQWTPRPGLEVWGIGGAGGGTLAVSDSFGTLDTAVGMRLAAGGVRQEVTADGGLGVMAEVFLVVLASVANRLLPEGGARATRARTLVEWQSEWSPSASMRIRPRVETGGRWDGGSDVGGFGAEVGGGVALVHVGLNLEVAGAARYLLAHQAEGFEEWGASVALRAGPGVTGSGPWVSLEPEWGAAASRIQAFSGPQADQLFSPAAVGGIDDAQPGRLRLEAGYALQEAGTDLILEVARENRGTDANLGVQLAATFGW